MIAKGRKVKLVYVIEDWFMMTSVKQKKSGACCSTSLDEVRLRYSVFLFWQSINRLIFESADRF